MSVPFNPELDLELVRDVPTSPALLWRCWTDPALLKQWFCPAPWEVTHVELELRPGGKFHTLMQGPGEDGEIISPPSEPGCVLEVVHERRLVLTDALGPGFRPKAEAFMTSYVLFDPLPGGGTRYRAVACHATVENRQAHLEMGFEEGWGAALDQLVALAATLQEKAEA